MIQFYIYIPFGRFTFQCNYPYLWMKVTFFIYLFFLFCIKYLHLCFKNCCSFKCIFNSLCGKWYSVYKQGLEMEVMFLCYYRICSALTVHISVLPDNLKLILVNLMVESSAWCLIAWLVLGPSCTYHSMTKCMTTRRITTVEEPMLL